MSGWCSYCVYSDIGLNHLPCSVCDRESIKGVVPPSQYKEKQPKNINFEDDSVVEQITKDKPYELLGQAIGQLVDEKNKAYGNSFNKIGDFLKLLYPDGVKPEQYSDMLALTRMFDKQMRIATRKDAFGESPYRDLVGYSLLGAKKDEGGNK